MLDFQRNMMLFILLISLAASAWGKPAYFHDPMINEGLIEGDIMIDPDTDRNAVPLDSQRWPGGLVPYAIDQSLYPLSGDILKAMRHIEEKTCIRFTPRTTHKHFVRLYKGNGCWSYIGFQNRGQQDLSLGVGCEPFGTIVHELLHAIGFQHEHMRTDRDKYLIIHWDNIEKEQYHNFVVLKPMETRLLTPFDFDSIMLYGHYTFNKAYGLKSMEARSGVFMPEVYNKPGMVASDITRMNMLYNC